MEKWISGIGTIKNIDDFKQLEASEGGPFIAGKDGVKEILGTKDGKTEFAVYQDKTLCYVKSLMGYPAIYPMTEPVYEGPAKALLMDLDGTSVRSEQFWMWIIEKTMQRLMGDTGFSLADEDEPFVSGHSVSEHLQYCITKYCPDQKVEVARTFYYEIVEAEMEKIMKGQGKKGAFVPTPGLKDFLLELKERQIKIGLVTSGLYNKAIPEIVSAFDVMGMGDPFAFYDDIITAGTAFGKGQAGTLSELAMKPHPWLYAETARVGLGISTEDKMRVIGMEDSSAGVLSLRLAGFSVIGIGGGNIEKAGVSGLCLKEYDNLCDALPLITGK
ncbi:HAD family hydrolase [uncultured Robinsoniella sp.]|uniref:HAD family hydrolase n=1 Tax=uncultured Robinsoniella sp. TaxID=904190 RepID=UPI00374FA7CC